MPKRTSTESKLQSLSQRQDATRVPLSTEISDSFESELNDGDQNSEPKAKGLSDEKSLDDQTEITDITPKPPVNGSSSTLSSRLPRLVTDQSVDQLQKSDIDTIFKGLIYQHRHRLHRNRRKGHVFRSSFEDLTVDPVKATIFDSPEVKHSQFYGFYILFWLAVGFFIFNDFVHEVFKNGLFIRGAPVFQIFTSDLPQIALADLLMYLTVYFAYFVQSMCANGHISWSKLGWILQSVYELVYFFFWVGWVVTVKLQWIGRVFLCMHSIVLLMKMHSYAFYNGYLWDILRELQFSENYLQRLKNKEVEVPENLDKDHVHKVLRESIAFCKFELLLQSGAWKKEEEDLDTKALSRTVERLTNEAFIKFPTNITLKDFFDYTMYPTVVYELSFARNPNVRWGFLFEKCMAIFGVIFLMLFVAEHQIYQLVVKAEVLRLTHMTFKERCKQYTVMLVDMIPPFMLEYLLVFYLIWDAILNAIGELSRYADRDFYGAWWSCVDWSEFSRLWNKPVHRFLLRHVYHSSISAFSFNKMQATLTTFIISSVIHELVMYIIFGRLRGYLLLFQMAQIPLVMLGRTPFMRDRKVLGNVICWFGFVSGPAIICTLYLIF